MIVNGCFNLMYYYVMYITFPLLAKGKYIILFIMFIYIIHIFSEKKNIF